MKTHSRRGDGRFAVPLTLFILTVALAVPGAFAAETDAVELHNGVFVAPETGSVYIMAPGGGIDALELTHGHVVWSTEEASKPLLLHGTTLVAQAEPSRAGELSLAVFDVAGAEAPTHRSRIELPVHVQGRVAKNLRNSFEARAEKVGDRVELAWKSEVRPAKGISPLVREDLDGPTDGKIALPKKARSTSLIDAGAATLDLTSGRVEKAAPRKASRATYGPVLIELPQADRLPGVDGRQFLSADGRHVLSSVRGETGKARTEHRWTLFRKADGRQIGEAVLPVSARPFYVQGSTLVLVTPPHTYQVGSDWAIEAYTVRGFDLLTGAERWKQEVRDAEWNGPNPH